MADQFQQTYFSYFWDQREPHVVKYDIERRCGILLERIKDAIPLTYVGVQPYFWLSGRIELRLEGSILIGTLYSLKYEAARGRDLYDEARFLADSDRAFHYWLRDFGVTQSTRSMEFATGDRYHRLVEAAIAFEEKQTAIHEDESEIAGAQQAVIAALRSGKRYTQSDHEGITSIQFEGDVLVKRRTGEETSMESYETPEAIMSFLRTYFDWEACRDTRPHRPPEVEIWKFICQQLR